MAVIKAGLRFFIGYSIQLPASLIERYPELVRARFRVGGIPTRLAGWALGQSSVAAITLGRTVFVSRGVSLDPGLVLHELRHVEQFLESKTFPIRYLWESLRRGYEANPYEADARRFSHEQLARAPESTTDKVGPKWSSTHRHRS